MVYRTPIPSAPQVANPAAQPAIAVRAAAPIAAGDPISAAHVTDAENEEATKEELYRGGMVTAEELGQSKIRTHAVVSQQVLDVYPGVGAPAWFAPAMNAALLPIRRSLARTWNSAAGDGIKKPWEIVPFVNGDDPTGPPHNLPPIWNLNELNQLQVHHVNAYLAGYGVILRPRQSLQAKRQQIGQQIGHY